MSFAGNTPSDPQSTRARTGSAFTSALGSAVGSAFGGVLGGRRGRGEGRAAGGAPGAGPSRRGARDGGVGEPAGSMDARRAAARRSGAGTDWARVGAFGAGIAIGALFGAGAALLYAPQSGLATRAVLRRKARHVTTRANDAWDELGSELRSVARRGRRKVKRGVTRSRWAAADLFDE